MKVAIFHNLPPGGARRALVDLVRSTRTMHDYDLFTIDLGRANRWPELSDAKELETLVNRVRRYPLFHGLASAGVGRVVNVEQVIRVQRRIAEDIDRHGYDLVFVHHEQFTGSPALLEHLKTPSAYYCQEPRRRSFEVGCGSARSFGVLAAPARAYEAVLRRRDLAAARAADLLLCNSVFSAESVLRAYGSRGRVCYLGVDTGRFSTADATQGDERPFVLIVGAIDAVKDPGLVVEAAARLPQRIRPVIEVIGERVEPTYHARLVERARTLGVVLRVVVGATDDELVARYRAAAATACVGRLEPFGLTTLESMACGTPVVAIREGGYREVVIDGYNGVMSEPSADSMAASLDRLLSNGVELDAEGLHAWVHSSWSLPCAGARLDEAFRSLVGSQS